MDIHSPYFQFLIRFIKIIKKNVSRPRPLSAIGDTLFPATLRILATSLVITMAAAGNVFAPILFLLIYNIPNYLARWYSLKYG